MEKTICCPGSDIYISNYQRCNRPQHQTAINNIPINPRLRPGFDSTPHNQRPPQEIEDWWGLPYIVTYTARNLIFLDNESKINWRKNWPTGTRYELRCLDNSAWDRSTNLGSFSSIRAVLARAETHLLQNKKITPTCNNKESTEQSSGRLATYRKRSQEAGTFGCYIFLLKHLLLRKKVVMEDAGKQPSCSTLIPKYE